MSDTTNATNPNNPTRATNPTAPSRPFPSSLPTVPGYAVSRVIGHGGMGVVYLAHDPTFEREVAIKVMHPDQDVRRFVVESRVTAQLPHPGVPPVYTLGRLADGRPFLAMKLIQGRTLSRELEIATNAELPRLLGVFEAICQTVGFAHSRGIVHRDLKPGNVMIGNFGEVLVLDWGLARAMRNAECGTRNTDDPATSGLSIPNSAFRTPHLQETTIGQVKGTPAYMAPEQARGEEVDPRADVFALGGILAVILTGNPPFTGDTALDTVLMAAQAELEECFADLDECGADPELVAIARQCLAPDAADRYTNGEEIAGAVAAYRTGVEERLRTAERDRAAAEVRAAEQRKRRKIQLALAASVLLLVCAGGGFAWWTDRRAAKQKLTDERAAAERKATEARQAADARQGVATNLALAADLRRQYKFKPAESALAQAARQAAGAPELAAEVRQAQADLAFVVRLDDIRYRKRVWIGEPGGKGRFDTESVASNYAKAFLERQLNLSALAPAAAARRVADSPIKAELVAALDDWALYEKDTVLRDRLLEVARRAAPHPWTDRLRDPALWDDGAPGTNQAPIRVHESGIPILNDRQERVLKFSSEPIPADVPPAAIVVLVELMQRAGIGAVAILTEARAKHPSDFELAFTLGQHLEKRQTDRIGPFEAARAIRPDMYAVWINLGNAMGATGDNTGSTAAFREAVRLNPNIAQARFCLGNALLRSALWAEAAAAFREAIRLDPQYMQAHSNLGHALFGAGQLDEALEAFATAHKLAPTEAIVLHGLTRVLLAKKDWANAIRACEAAVASDPKDAEAYGLLGTALDGAGRPQEAAEAWTKARALDPKLAQSQTRRADALRDRGRTDEAIAAYREALRADPSDYFAHYGLGQLLSEKGDHPGAVAAHREAVRLAPKVATVYHGLGVALKRSGDPKGALTAYMEAVKLDPHLGETYTNLGILFRELKDYDNALAAYQNAVRFRPTRETHHGLGGILHLKGDFPAAAAAFREAIKLDLNWDEGHNGLCLALRCAGDVPGAIAAGQTAVRLNPKNGDAYFNLGAAYQKKGDDAAALEAYRKSNEFDRKRTDAHTNAGNILARRGDPDGALAEYDAALKRNPNAATTHLNKGIILYERRDADGALAAAHAAIAADPKLAEAYILLGNTLLLTGNEPEARKAFAQAAELGAKLIPADRDREKKP